MRDELLAAADAPPLALYNDLMQARTPYPLVSNGQLSPSLRSGASYECEGERR